MIRSSVAVAIIPPRIVGTAAARLHHRLATLRLQLKVLCRSSAASSWKVERLKVSQRVYPRSARAFGEALAVMLIFCSYSKDHLCH